MDEEQTEVGRSPAEAGSGCQPSASAVPASRSGIPNAAEGRCECDRCTYNAAYRDHIERVPTEDREFWEEMFSRYFHTQDDLDHANVILDGSWPSAVEQLHNALGKAIEIRNERKGWGI